jgi:2-methylisocitrate lyase-like PEP mutase family enzyme
MGIATATEIIDRARQIAAAIHIPVVADGDTGYGSITNVRQTIRGFESAGVSGVHIEDQTMPKKLGSMVGIAVVDTSEMVEKIRIACKSRRDPNFVIIGRTDAYASSGIDEVIHRCKAYGDAGADVLYAHNIVDRDHLQKLARSIRNVPLLYDVVEPKATYSDKELEELGFKIIFHGRANILYQAQAAVRLWTYYRDHGETAGCLDHMMSPEDWSALIGNEAELNIREWLDS